ncbi:MAG: ATP-dependent metalloprotease FtsH, cell division protease FtsH [Candidatus Peregrinibacteria bacterium GW2011_GWE2_39_6]|nr:MAG: ATP-dependent metalloprotease FtsH, cell division protease FtsH [Candidatus Peregrinibacteria bacterium GW2011_GWF2_39_17]KKR24831.1 MAG: ATP-dependent metalloprotease FtsH, cell division protease FtsH [Candidatus Peregrinibacteria bacterium GW2011_GWE2_39_6]HCW32780.1 cell division protein FtsH [Candidatus Peregrinibacteria bacterium]
MSEDFPKPQIPKIPQKHQNSFLYVLIVALVITSLYFFFSSPKSVIEKVPLNTFIENVNQGQVTKIEVNGNRINFSTKKDGVIDYYTVKEPSATLNDLLKDAPLQIVSSIDTEIVDTQATSFWRDLLISLIPFALIIVFFMFMMRQAQNSNNQAISFGKSRARLSDDSANKRTTFANVAGAKEAKEELAEIVDFLKHPKKYLSIGAKIPKGVILIGPPGCGKTLLARAVAGEADVPFFNISGSEFVEMFVGVGASRVRDLFKRAKRNAPCIIFIDEIDAVGRHRGAGLGGGHDEREQTLNQILTEMDGFEQGTNVIVIAATNRPDVLDPALLRPGRFDRRIVVDQPDIKDREEILKVHSRNKPLDKTVDLLKIAQQTPGFSGADLENLMNEAAILTARQNKRKISMQAIENSIEKVVMGPERKSRVMSKEEKRITAYHEAGHAIVGYYSPKCDPIHKISIISRGMSLGATWFLPEEDKHLNSRSKYMSELSALMGGYTSEELIFGEMTTGASNDLERASLIARRMVKEFGMSKLGPIIYGESEQEVFLGKDFNRMRNYSEKIAAQIDDEVEKILKTAYESAQLILKKHQPVLHKIAENLLQKETLTHEEFMAFFEKSPPKKIA